MPIKNGLNPRNATPLNLVIDWQDTNGNSTGRIATAKGADGIADRVQRAIEWSMRNLLAPTSATVVLESHGAAVPHITYSRVQPADGSVWLPMSDVLDKICTGQPLSPSDFDTLEYRGQELPVARCADGRVDIVLTAFIFLSGYDEFSTTRRDRHGRYTYRGSLHEKLGCAKLPVVDYLRLHLIDALGDLELADDQFKDVAFEVAMDRDWSVCPTTDIDYIRKWRPGIIYRELVENPILNYRKVGALPRLRRLAAAVGQFTVNHNVYLRSLEHIRTTVRKLDGHATFFVKTGAREPYDVHYRRDGYVNTFVDESIRQGHEVGLHPSYWAAHDNAQLDEEIGKVEELIDGKLESVRTHYLRWSEHTQRALSERGVQVDSTLGFPDYVGFRRGTCHPFNLFDFESWQGVDLVELPLIMMDSAVFNRLMLAPEAAVDTTNRILDHCMEVGGSPVLLWHNIILDTLDCPGWNVHFDAVMTYAKEHGARIETVRAAAHRRS